MFSAVMIMTMTTDNYIGMVQLFDEVWISVKTPLGSDEGYAYAMHCYAWVRR